MEIIRLKIGFLSISLISVNSFDGNNAAYGCFYNIKNWGKYLENVFTTGKINTDADIIYKEEAAYSGLSDFTNKEQFDDDRILRT